MKKAICLLLIGAMTATMLTGCGSSSTSSTASTASSGETLNLFVWTEYVPDSVIKKFEDETGIKVNVSTYSSNEDMLAKVKAESEGTYDIVQPSDYMVKQMTTQGMLEKLDKSKLPNIKNLSATYLNQSYDPDNTYSVPYQGGVAAIAVNTKKVNMDITSYDDLFNPKLAGTEVALDDYRAVIGMTARSMGMSMNETDKDKLSKISDKLQTLKKNVKLYDSDSPKSALISGDCTVGYCWSAEIALAMDENPDIKIVFPKEGAYVFMDNWCIPKGAKHSDAATKFINFMLDSKVDQMVLKEFPYMSPNAEAVKAMGADFQANQAKNPPADVVSKGERVGDLDTDTLAIYDSMWTKLKQ
jgi:spermidine/putrescine-binding protein